MENVQLLIGAFAALQTLAIFVLSFILNSTNNRIKELYEKYSNLHNDFTTLKVKIAAMEATQIARADQFDVLSKKLDILTERVEHQGDKFDKSMKDLFEKYDIKLKQ